MQMQSLGPAKCWRFLHTAFFDELEEVRSGKAHSGGLPIPLGTTGVLLEEVPRATGRIPYARRVPQLREELYFQVEEAYLEAKAHIYRKLQKLPKSGSSESSKPPLTTVDDKKESICDGCAIGKMHRLPFRPRPNKATKVEEVIHADFNGPMEKESIGRAKYFACFKDEFSKFRRLFFLKHKSETHDALKSFLNEAKTKGHVIKSLRCDGGKEFDNKDTRKMLSEFGIDILIGPPHTPQQNGSAERENC
ncbi:UNVERIFIED_CONTAM: hypothetical protein PYX00_009678 [Menopon gallinae]|uniref:Integrase catalytic domain-containing protein n=1 Tax=Menopon gallinae TaxID=328185 RepID=A0AAW2HD03_9NEOP